MKYIVIEIQKASDGTISVPPVATYDTFFSAMAAYHTILASAAVSQVPVHTAVVLTDTGQQIRLDSFNHTASPDEEIIE